MDNLLFESEVILACGKEVAQEGTAVLLLREKELLGAELPGNIVENDDRGEQSAYAGVIFIKSLHALVGGEGGKKSGQFL